MSRFRDCLQEYALPLGILTGAIIAAVGLLATLALKII